MKQKQSSLLNTTGLSDRQIEMWLYTLPVTLSSKQINKVLDDSIGHKYIVWKMRYRFFYFD